ncbi:MAG: Sec-independent protein translocase subunit TatA/TatB [Microthrixaceae bacterium]
MFNGPEIWIIVIVLLVLFGGSQLPKLARSLGEAQKELKKGMKDGEGETDAASDKS